MPVYSDEGGESDIAQFRNLLFACGSMHKRASIVVKFGNVTALGYTDPQFVGTAIECVVRAEACPQLRGLNPDNRINFGVKRGRPGIHARRDRVLLNLMAVAEI